MKKIHSVKPSDCRITQNELAVAKNNNTESITVAIAAAAASTAPISAPVGTAALAFDGPSQSFHQKKESPVSATTFL